MESTKNSGTDQISKTKSDKKRGFIPGNLRELNLQTVLKIFLEADGPVSRAQIAQRAGITRATVSKLTEEFLNAGFLRPAKDLDQELDKGPGRPGIPMEINPEALFALGLAVNVSGLSARLVSLSGATVALESVDQDLRYRDPEEVLERLRGLALNCLQALKKYPQGRLLGACLSLPGLVDEDARYLLRAPNLGWNDRDFTEYLQGFVTGQAYLQVANESNVTSQVVRAKSPGGIVKHDSFIFISGEIGIGMTAVLDGQILNGANGWAGEIGHVCIDPNGALCTCGARGCLETVTGRRALMNNAGRPVTTPGADLLKAIADGDHLAQKAVARAGRALGQALAGVVNVLDIHTIVLGGHLAELTEALRPTIQQELNQRVLSSNYAPNQVLAGSSDVDLPSLGAAFQVFDHFLTEPERWL
ncbi:ROK family transcriptional regulator [Boudabousia liubingyangii]|uniref:ROK family transcriptional regulator n=1 Tax=Boudabousia liubingyangii TaxID=1921764 RepID=UPI0009F91EEB|nr:ROK family transcriptional regulator [Boudabousia liubingyangii]